MQESSSLVIGAPGWRWWHWEDDNRHGDIVAYRIMPQGTEDAPAPAPKQQAEVVEQKVILPAHGPGGAVLTMNSREIAELTGKEHFNVCRDIRTMLNELKEDQFKFEAVYLDAKGEKRTCYLLPKDLTITLVSGYSTPMRHRIVTRWMELEAGVLISELGPCKLVLFARLSSSKMIYSKKIMKNNDLSVDFHWLGR